MIFYFTLISQNYRYFFRKSRKTNDQRVLMPIY